MSDHNQGDDVTQGDLSLPDCAVALVVVVSDRDGQRRVVAEFMPDATDEFLRGLMLHTPENWIKDAPAGVYSFGYNPILIKEGDEPFVTIDFRMGASSTHGEVLGRALARELIMAGEGLMSVLNELPDEAKITERFDNIIMQVLRNAATAKDFRHIVPGFSRVLVTTKREHAQAIENACKEGVVATISIIVPDASYPFHTHLKELMEARVQRATARRENLVVCSRVRALQSKRKQVVAKWQCERLDAEIDHLCLEFGIEEETVLAHGWNLLQDFDEETESVELSGFPTIEA